MRKPSTTDLNDAPWEIIDPLIPPAKSGGQPGEVDHREGLHPMLYQARASRRWELLSHDLLPRSTVWDSFQ